MGHPGDYSFTDFAVLPYAKLGGDVVELRSTTSKNQLDMEDDYGLGRHITGAKELERGGCQRITMRAHRVIPIPVP